MRIKLFFEISGQNVRKAFQRLSQVELKRLHPYSGMCFHVAFENILLGERLLGISVDFPKYLEVEALSSFES